MISVLALGAILLPGCAGMNGGGSNLASRVDQHDQQIQMLLSQVGQVEQVLPGQAEMWAQMQTMRQELTMLNGRLEELQAGGMGGGDSGAEMVRMRDKVARIETVVRQMASQLAVNVDTLNVSYTGAPYAAGQQAGQAGGPAPSAVVPTGTTPSGPPAATLSDSAETLYDSGIRQFDQRRYKEAVVTFKDFVAAHPKHKLAGNAHFWEGESHFQLKDYKRAALAYDEVIQKFPGSPKVQSSMLKQAIALHHLGSREAAKEGLGNLIKRYPNSPEATRAKQFLAANP